MESTGQRPGSSPSVLIAGSGSIGRRHLRNLQALGVEDIRLYRTGRGRAAADQFSGLPVFADLDEALAERPTAVVVANPTSLHLPVALRAAEAGCHLLIEKPLSHSMEDVARLRELVRQNDLIVLLGYQFRFHPALGAIKGWLEENRIGPVISLHAHWGEYLPDWHPGEDYRRGYSARQDLGGGVLLTLCHPIDYLRWLAGEITRIGAVLGRRSSLEIDTEDTALLSLEFGSGAVGSIYLDYLQRPPQHTLTIVGEQGLVTWNQANHTAILEPPGSGRREVCPPPEGFERNGMFRDEMEHFIRCIRGLSTPRCTLDDGIAALQVVLAAKRADGEGRVVEYREAVPAG
jgi:predicted dehydrogenase